eukprot:scaffold1237_cov403-Prasinococcus_capsulatus_cf.AAC.11
MAYHVSGVARTPYYTYPSTLVCLPPAAAGFRCLLDQDAACKASILFTLFQIPKPLPRASSATRTAQRRLPAEGHRRSTRGNEKSRRHGCSRRVGTASQPPYPPLLVEAGGQQYVRFRVTLWAGHACTRQHVSSKKACLASQPKVWSDAVRSSRGESHKANAGAYPSRFSRTSSGGSRRNKSSACDASQLTAATEKRRHRN